MTIHFAILTVSDRSSLGQRADASGPALVDLVESKGYQVAKLDIVPDEVDAIQNKLMAWSDADEADVILTTGGTGVAPRDVTPEATRVVIERLTPGIDEAMRAASLKITPHAMLSRAISGIRKRTLIINLPGSPKGAVENAQVVLPVLEHAVKLLRDEDAGH
jgi:molybdenum cofactor synthesis domain-containing protein